MSRSTRTSEERADRGNTGRQPASGARATDTALLMFAGVLCVAAPLTWWSRPLPLPSGQEAGLALDFRIDPNHADAATLELLPGIGPATAAKIIADRAERGPFQSAGDLERISGIGPKTVEGIGPWVRFER